MLILALKTYIITINIKQASVGSSWLCGGKLVRKMKIRQVLLALLKLTGEINEHRFHSVKRILLQKNTAPKAASINSKNFYTNMKCKDLLKSHLKTAKNIGT